MSLEAALKHFYDRHGFGNTLGARPKTVPVYTGCLLVPLPNIETRNRFLKYHDLHHLVTGYSVGRIGEGEVSSWELGTGSMRVSPILGFMNLIALSTGWVLAHERMWQAYSSGLQSRNLYTRRMRAAVEEGRWALIEDLRAEVVEVRPQERLTRRRRAIFQFYIGLSLVIHAVIAIPAVVARTASDLRQGKSLAETLRPTPRADLY